MVFTLAAHFAVATQGENWRSDPIAYAEGAAAVFAGLIRDVPDSPDRKLAIEGMVSRLLTLLAQEREASR